MMARVLRRTSSKTESPDVVSAAFRSGDKLFVSNLQASSVLMAMVATWLPMTSAKLPTLFGRNHVPCRGHGSRYVDRHGVSERSRLAGQAVWIGPSQPVENRSEDVTSQVRLLAKGIEKLLTMNPKLRQLPNLVQPYGDSSGPAHWTDAVRAIWSCLAKCSTT